MHSRLQVSSGTQKATLSPRHLTEKWTPKPTEKGWPLSFSQNGRFFVLKFHWQLKRVRSWKTKRSWDKKQKLWNQLLQFCWHCSQVPPPHLPNLQLALNIDGSLSFGNYQQFLLLSSFRMEIINCTQVVCNHLCCHLAMWQLPKIIIAVIFLSFGKYWKLLFLSSRHF